MNARRSAMLYLEDLQHLSCSDPDCPDTHDGPLYWRSRCHPTVGTWVVFQPGSTHLHVICAKCEQLIARVAVASRRGVDEAYGEAH
jgi:hypothetical protein